MLKTSWLYKLVYLYPEYNKGYELKDTLKTVFENCQLI